MEVPVMKSNVGTVDKAIRFVIGAVIIAIGYYYQSWWGLLGLIPLATAAFGFCPAYLPFGINTHKKGKAK
jgi:hypothetical protein